MGKAYEDRKEYEHSFRHYARGNEIKRGQLRYRQEGSTRETDEQIGACQAPCLKKKQGVMHPIRFLSSDLRAG